MTKVYSAQSALTVGNLRNLLLSEGIESEVRIPFLAAAGGDLPMTECWSQLWIVNDEDLDRAMKLIDGTRQTGAPTSESWKCPQCGEEIEGQFEACWRCGLSRPDGDG
jgi:Putative prokaryotic signal transducing protein